ncbi:hypothetical protein [Croceiramulus getboli]|nr:hypothetical protein P8624_07395 [Flavobacteriaceae bacterium YJPT1-3]
MLNKLNLKSILVLCIAVLSLSACEENDIPIFDAENGRAIAGFNGAISNPKIVFNPAADTENTITIGVSTLSSSDRMVQLDLIEEETTLDESFYTISSLSPVIPAGQFTVDIMITTLASEILPGSRDEIVLELVSVEGAEILEDSESLLNIGLDVQCPSVDLSAIPGSYTVTASTFANFFGETDFTREIIAGPGENQFTILEGTYITEDAEELIFTVDPSTGAVTAYDETKIESQVSFGPNTYKYLPGGRVLTCVGIIELNIDFGGSIMGNAHVFNLIKD